MSGRCAAVKLLFNASTNVMGGPVQNAVNFILASLEDQDQTVEWSYVVSRAVADQLAHPGSGDRSFVIEKSPSKDPRARRELRALTHSVRPAAVYTMAGPSYVDFEPLHIQGCSNPYLTSLDRQTLRYGRDSIEVLTTWMRNRYQYRHMLHADRWIFQTEASRSGFLARSGIRRERTAVIPNALGASFISQLDAGTTLPRCEGQTRRILVPSADYPHKAIPFVFDVVVELRRRMPDERFRFVITVPEDSPSLRRMQSRQGWSDVEPFIIVHGRYDHADAPGLYASADAVFLPSILEVFSTSYLEAIAMGRPLVVPDLQFTREICCDYAVYFEKLNARSAAETLYAALRHPVEAPSGKNGLQWIRSKYPDYRERYHALRAVILDWVADSA